MISETQQFEVFYDGDCPLCLREIKFLRRKDKHDRIRFTDIAASDFSAAELGKSHGELMAEIHGRLADGTFVKGVEVFRNLYEAVGFGPVVMATRLPVIRQILDLGYWAFAKNRLRLTGRCDDGKCSVS